MQSAVKWRTCRGLWSMVREGGKAKDRGSNYQSKIAAEDYWSDRRLEEETGSNCAVTAEEEEEEEEQEEEGGVPRGHIPVLVGKEEEKTERFFIHLKLLKHPMIEVLLDMAVQEFGYEHPGILTIPCDIEHFRLLIHLISPSPTTSR